MKVMPGVYSEQVTMKPYVDIEGAGELTTKITYTGSSGNSGTVMGANNAELRFLSVESTSGNLGAIAVFNNNASPRLTHVTASASGGSVDNVGMYNSNSSPVMTNVTISAVGGNNNAYGMLIINSSPVMTNVTASASGSTNGNFGIYNSASSVTIQDSVITAGGASGNRIGIKNSASSGAYTVLVINSQVSGATNSIYLESHFTVRVGASQLSGGPVATNGGTVTYVGSYDGDFTLNGNQTFSGIPAFNGGVSGSTSPFTVNSNTLVSSLNADLLDGQHAGNASGSIPLNNSTLNTNLNADLLDGKHTLQVGDALRRASPPQANTATAVDAGGDVGSYASITIGADGLPVVSHRDNTNGDLKVLHCGNAACTAGNTLTAVDTGGDVGGYTSITIDVDGLPVVSYRDNTNQDLKVLHCGNAACTAGNTATAVDTGVSVGWYTSITIGADGVPVVSYSDWGGSSDLKVLHCGNADCTAGNTTTTVDTVGDVGWYTSIIIGADGLPVVSYTDYTNQDLKVLRCGNAACSAGNTVTAVDTVGAVGTWTSITIGADGLPVVSYRDETNLNLKIVHCGDAACAAGNTLTTVDTGGNRRLFHLDHHRRGRPARGQLLGLQQPSPEGAALRERRLLRRQHRDGRRHGREHRIAQLDHDRRRRPARGQLLRRHQRRPEGAALRERLLHALLPAAVKGADHEKGQTALISLPSSCWLRCLALASPRPRTAGRPTTGG